MRGLETIDIEGRSQSWPPFFPGMERDLGVFGFLVDLHIETKYTPDHALNYFEYAPFALTTAYQSRARQNSARYGHDNQSRHGNQIPGLFWIQSARSVLHEWRQSCRAKLTVC